MNFGFMNLYYDRYYDENMRLLDEPISYPYKLLIRNKEERLELDRLLNAAGFTCVGGENGYPGYYVNMTFKRYGRIPKAVESSSLNDEPMSYQEFVDQILSPYINDPKFSESESDNYLCILKTTRNK